MHTKYSITLRRSEPGVLYSSIISTVSDLLIALLLKKAIKKSLSAIDFTIRELSSERVHDIYDSCLENLKSKFDIVCEKLNRYPVLRMFCDILMISVLREVCKRFIDKLLIFLVYCLKNMFYRNIECNSDEFDAMNLAFNEMQNHFISDALEKYYAPQ